MGWNRWLKGRRADHAGRDPRATPVPGAPDSELLVFTEGQRRHLEIAFRNLLTGAQETQARIRGRGASAGEPPGLVHAIAAEIDGLIVETRRAATTLGLPLDTPKIPWQRELAAWAATSWSMILDCRPAALHGYGSVDARLARAVGPVVDRIAAQLLRVERMAEAVPDPHQHNG